jgi:hypothetical protein
MVRARRPRWGGRNRHATIHRYQAAGGEPGDWGRTWRALATHLSGVPGFVSFVVLEAGGGEYAAISFFDDATSLAAADGLVERWLAAHLGPSMGRSPPQCTTGEIVAQRGL